jgi:hypothetical protein
MCSTLDRFCLRVRHAVELLRGSSVCLLGTRPRSRQSVQPRPRVICQLAHAPSESCLYNRRGRDDRAWRWRQHGTSLEFWPVVSWRCS